MGNRDKGSRETKKPRKDAKKNIITPIATPPPAVEVFRKERKKREEEET